MFGSSHLNRCQLLKFWNTLSSLHWNSHIQLCKRSKSSIFVKSCPPIIFWLNWFFWPWLQLQSSYADLFLGASTWRCSTVETVHPDGTGLYEKFHNFFTFQRSANTKLFSDSQQPAEDQSVKASMLSQDMWALQVLLCICTLAKTLCELAASGPFGFWVFNLGEILTLSALYKWARQKQAAHSKSVRTHVK